MKLGGSLVTVKDRPYTVRGEALAGASRILAAYWRSGGRRLIVVHGGGSFGHYEVDTLRGELGARDLPAAAAPRIQGAMLRLAARVVEALRGAGLPASLHTTHTICECRECRYTPLLRDLGEGLVPVAYGDAVPCRGGLVIVSGDQLVVEAGLEAGVDCIVFTIDAPGVLDGEGRVIGELGPGDPVPRLGGAAHDVTGGLEAKVEWARRAAAGGARVYITGLGGLLKVLEGGRAGTRIVV